MTSSALPPVTSTDISDSSEDNNDATLVAELGELAEHIRLVKMEGRVFIRFSGTVKAGHLLVPYALVPAQGVLARPAKWRKMEREAKLALVRERASAAAFEELRQHVMDFVADIAGLSEDVDTDPMLFLHTLADMQTSEPAGMVFDVC
ncbi:MAG: RNA helicase, partial [Janthinobacterium lividum]|nr:RNA helicase [Janthinobacterium lividum]